MLLTQLPAADPQAWLDEPLLAVGQSEKLVSICLGRKTHIIPAERDTMFALREDSSSQEVQMERAIKSMRLDLLPCTRATCLPLPARYYRNRHEDRDVSRGGLLVPAADNRCLDSRFLSTVVYVVHLGTAPGAVAREGR